MPRLERWAEVDDAGGAGGGGDGGGGGGGPGDAGGMGGGGDGGGGGGGGGDDGGGVGGVDGRSSTSSAAGTAFAKSDGPPCTCGHTYPMACARGLGAARSHSTRSPNHSRNSCSVYHTPSGARRRGDGGA